MNFLIDRSYEAPLPPIASIFLDKTTLLPLVLPVDCMRHSSPLASRAVPGWHACLARQPRHGPSRATCQARPTKPRAVPARDGPGTRAIVPARQNRPVWPGITVQPPVLLPANFFLHT